MRRIVGVGLGAIAAWLAAIAVFAVYVNWFSESGRDGDWLVLGSAWLAVVTALAATFAFGAMLAFEVADRVRRHA